MFHLSSLSYLFPTITYGSEKMDTLQLLLFSMPAKGSFLYVTY